MYGYFNGHWLKKSHKVVWSRCFPLRTLIFNACAILFNTHAAFFFSCVILFNVHAAFFFSCVILFNVRAVLFFTCTVLFYACAVLFFACTKLFNAYAVFFFVRTILFLLMHYYYFSQKGQTSSCLIHFWTTWISSNLKKSRISKCSEIRDFLSDLNLPSFKSPEDYFWSLILLLRSQCRSTSISWSCNFNSISNWNSSCSCVNSTCSWDSPSSKSLTTNCKADSIRTNNSGNVYSSVIKVCKGKIQ